MDELENIQSRIYVIHGQRVMLDFDLATIYQVETVQLKRQVRRNMERFEGEVFLPSSIFPLTSSVLLLTSYIIHHPAITYLNTSLSCSSGRSVT